MDDPNILYENTAAQEENRQGNSAAVLRKVELQLNGKKTHTFTLQNFEIDLRPDLYTANISF